MDENTLILSRLKDLSERSEKYNYTTISKFTSAKEQQMAAAFKHISMWGGYSEAERKLIAFTPDDTPPDEIDWGIAVIQIATAGGERYSHRDYLGSLVGLGIKREVLGDIIITPQSALLFCLDTIAPFVIQNLESVSKSAVSCSYADLGNLQIPDKEYMEMTGSVAKVRIDSVLSVAIGKSRSQCQEILQSGAVQLNYTEMTELSRTVKAGDILSVRGYGKFIFDGCVHVSKKGRNIIKLRKYI